MVNSEVASVARVILRAVVKDLKVRPGDYVHLAALRIALELRDLPLADLRAGLHHAQQSGWLRFDANMRMYALTEVGFGTI